LISEEVRIAKVSWVRYPMCGLEFEELDAKNPDHEAILLRSKKLIKAKRG